MTARASTIFLLLGLVACTRQEMARVVDYVEAPTYYADVEPILNRRCTRCHQPGTIAPFSLLAVDDVMKKLDLVTLAVAEESMPPMPASAADDCPEIDDPRVMPKEERELVARWADQGAPLGEPRPESPLPPLYGALGAPTHGFDMIETYTIEKKRADDYRCFIVDPKITETVPVSAISVEPGNPLIVHHAAAYLIDPTAAPTLRAIDAADAGPGYACFGGVGVANAYAAGLWVPGMAPVPPPKSGLGGWLPPGWLLVLQVHYNFDHPQAFAMGAATDRSRIVAWRSTAPVTEVPSTMILGDWTIDLPPGPSSIQRSVTGTVLPTGWPAALGQVDEGLIYSTWAHQHLLGKSFKMDLVRFDGSSQCLLHIPRWDFHWQGVYPLKHPVATHAGDRVTVTCEWDNSPAMYPDGEAPRQVHYGETTKDEMCIGTLASMRFF